MFSVLQPKLSAISLTSSDSGSTKLLSWNPIRTCFAEYKFFLITYLIENNELSLNAQVDKNRSARISKLSTKLRGTKFILPQTIFESTLSNKLIFSLPKTVER